MITVLVLGATLPYGAAVQASTPASDTKTVADLAQKYLSYESALVLDEENPQAPKAEDRPVVTGTARTTASTRYGLKIDERVVNQAGDVRFSSVRTTTSVERQNVTASKATLEVAESTAYHYADGSPEYSYDTRHSFTFTKTSGRWTISGIETLSPTSPLFTARLQTVRSQSVQARRSAAAQRVSSAYTAIKRDLPQLLAADKTKRGGKSPAPRDSRTSGTAAPQSAVARPSAAPLRTIASPAARKGYNYKKMVDWVYKYAKGRKVDYTRDSNDCTTFISMGLGKGGWKEKTGFFKSSSAWWYNCDWCKPRHSYTFGAAYNWQVFAYSKSKRVKALKYMTDLAYADVGQLDINGYGRPKGPDHTMMVTGRNSKGWALMSYHSADTRNKPLNQILSAHDGPYWALRT